MKIYLIHTFGTDTVKQINGILKKRNTRVIALIMIYEQGNYSTIKVFKVLSCVVYTMIEKYVCIDYLCTLNNKLSEIKVNYANLNKHEDQDYNNLFGIGIPDILMNIVSCHGFINNDDSIVILKCPNRMSQYYFNKGFTEITINEERLKKLPDLVKIRIGAEMSENSDLVMQCITTITSTSTTLKNLHIGTEYHESYSTNIYSDQTEKMDRLFKTYITPQLKDIYHPAILQELKMNIDAKEYEQNKLHFSKPSEKK